VLRMFHSSVKRHRWAPPSEPADPLPDDLTILGLTDMPAPPAPPKPTKRDVAKSDGLAKASSAPLPSDAREEFISSLYPSFEPAILKIGLHSKLSEHVDIASLRAKHFELADSVFAPRKLVADSGAFYDNDECFARGLDIDFARCNQERFRIQIGLYDARPAGTMHELVDLKEIKAVLRKNAKLISRVFQYYAALGAGSGHGDGNAILQSEYLQLLAVCNIPDEASPACKAEDCNRIFVSTHQQERSLSEEHLDGARDTKKEEQQPFLLRFEFMQCLVRLSIAKYIKIEQKKSAFTSQKAIKEISEVRVDDEHHSTSQTS